MYDTLRRHADTLHSRHGHKSGAMTDRSVINLMNLATRITGRAPTNGNAITIYHEDEQNFNASESIAADAGARHAARIHAAEGPLPGVHQHPAQHHHCQPW